MLGTDTVTRTVVHRSGRAHAALLEQSRLEGDPPTLQKRLRQAASGALDAACDQLAEARGEIAEILVRSWPDERTVQRCL